MNESSASFINFSSDATSNFIETPCINLFRGLADAQTRKSFGFVLGQIQAHAGAFWLVSEQDGQRGLTISVNEGDRGPEIEGKVFQPIDKGLVCEAFSKNETVCHQGVFRHDKQSDDIDKELGQVTAHQIAVPFSMFGKAIGAVTAIQSLASGISHHTQWGFDQDAIDTFENFVRLSERLFEYNLIRGIE